MTLGFVPKSFTEAVLAKFLRTVTFTPYTLTTDNVTGSETLVAGTAQTIRAAYFNQMHGWAQEKQGKYEYDNGYVIVPPEVSPRPKKDDTFVVGNITFRITDTTTRYGGANNAELLYVACEVFRTSTGD
jgi:hypothetical protein